MLGDFDGDKLLDVLVVEPAGIKLLKNNGKNQFVDVSAKSGVLKEPIGGARARCGPTSAATRSSTCSSAVCKGPNRYFENAGNGTFEDKTESLGFYQRVFNTGAMALVDLNKDRRADLVLNNEGQESVVLLGKAKSAPVNQTAQDSR